MKPKAYAPFPDSSIVVVDIIFSKGEDPNSFSFQIDRKAFQAFLNQVDYFIDTLKKVNEGEYSFKDVQQYIRSVNCNVKFFVSEHGIDDKYYFMNVDIDKGIYFRKRISQFDYIEPKFIKRMNKFYEQLKEKIEKQEEK